MALRAGKHGFSQTLLDKMVSIRKLQSGLVDECRIYLVPVLGFVSYCQTHSCFTETGVV